MNEKLPIDPMPRDYGFGSDEEMLRDLATKLLDEQMPIEKMRRTRTDNARAGTSRFGSNVSSWAGRGSPFPRMPAGSV